MMKPCIRHLVMSGQNLAWQIEWIVWNCCDEEMLHWLNPMHVFFECCCSNKYLSPLIQRARKRKFYYPKLNSLLWNPPIPSADNCLYLYGVRQTPRQRFKTHARLHAQTSRCAFFDFHGSPFRFKTKIFSINAGPADLTSHHGWTQKLIIWTICQ